MWSQSSGAQSDTCTFVWSNPGLSGVEEESEKTQVKYKFFISVLQCSTWINEPSFTGVSPVVYMSALAGTAGDTEGEDVLGDTGGAGGWDRCCPPADVPPANAALTSYWCGSGPSPAHRLRGWRWWLDAAVEPIGRQLQGDTHRLPDARTLISLTCCLWARFISSSQNPGVNFQNTQRWRKYSGLLLKYWYQYHNVQIHQYKFTSAFKLLLRLKYCSTVSFMQ